MKRRVKKNIGLLMNDLICLVVLVAFVACNAEFKPSFKASITDENMRSRVSRVIDAQMDNIKGHLDEETRTRLEEYSSKGAGNLSGDEIVSLAMKESGGRDYLDFCYAVDVSSSFEDTSAVLETARSILPRSEYENLSHRAEELEKSIQEKGYEIAKGIPLNQQAAFFRDLKTLTVRAIVLLVAGVVYATMPTLVFWGKISAACAIAVGAGLVAMSIMSLYEYYRFGTGEGTSFEQWFKEMIEVPKADFAMTTTVTAIAEALGAGPVVTGIIICVFGLYNTVDLLRTMLKTYNFNA